VRFPDFSKELAGGATAAALTLPIGIALGIFTLEPLGAHFASLGVAAGVYGVVLATLLPVIFGSRAAIINVPRSVTAVFVAAMLLQASGVHQGVAGEAPAPEFLYATVFFFLALSGAFQALIGLFRMGTLVKYLPHSVLAGFMNAVAILLAFAQLPALLGMPAGTSPAEIMVVPEQMRLGSLVVAGVTLGALSLPGIKATRLPPFIVGLVAGTLAHHALAAAGLEGSLGPLLGQVPDAHPRLETAADFRHLLDNAAFIQALPGIAAAAFGLALIVSLDSLLLMKTFERMTHARHDSQREIARMGIANTIAACVGAIPCSMSLAASQANHASGGRGAASVVAHCVVAIVAVLALGPLLAAVPRAVVAALLLSIAFVVIDRPTLAIVRKLVAGNVRNRARLATDVLVMLTVASIAMLASVPLAVAAGLFIAVLSFLVNMSHSVVRRVIPGDATRSRRSRGAAQMELLEQLGSQIAVIELEGVIFFGTADDLLVRIDQCLREGARHIIIDLSRVHDVDTTGAQMLIQIRERVSSRGGTLIVSHAAPGQPQWDFLVDTGVVASLGQGAFTPDTDRALEIAENVLLESTGDPSMRAEIPLRALNLFARLAPGELAVLSPLLTRRTFNPGEFVFREGDPGDDLFVIARGTASVYRVDGERSMRLITFGEGTVFGEMALLDAKPRSASVQADNAMVCYVMSRAVFDELVARHDAIALKLLTSLSQELGRRVRFANEIIDHLQA
jgi:MFS superfamily sulfate permease-like transporter